MKKSLIVLMVLSLTVGCTSLKPKFVGKQFRESPYYLSVNEKTFTNYSNVTRKVNPAETRSRHPDPHLVGIHHGPIGLFPGPG